MSDEPSVVIVLDGDSRHYGPGETLSGEYWIESVDSSQVASIEASVLWRTEGKGDEDMAVHEFWRRRAEEGQLLEPRRPERFSTVLPRSPLSYDGQIIKLRWCFRVRAFLHRGKDVVGEREFRLGAVSPSHVHG
ncbi:MAG: hypothetical protein LLG00_13860 [Planctomycetaceae bacterium]|nr:hypothetical protein [Planctomycetaceae bacterium]